jgi:hypothetical protein
MIDPEQITPQQIRNIWVKMTAAIYQRHENSFQSTRKLIVESEDVEECFFKDVDDVLALGFIVKKSFTSSQEMKEVALDSTFSTNRDGFELFCFINNRGGSGETLSYLYLNVKAAPSEARCNTLEEYFQTLKDKGLRPRFLLTDKDAGQINAVQRAWPGVEIRLCLWHLDRAIKRHFRNNKKPERIFYDKDTLQEFPELIDPNWIGSLDDDSWERQRLTDEMVSLLLKLMKRHFCYHSLIPVDANGTLLTREKIRVCVSIFRCP